MGRPLKIKESVSVDVGFNNPTGGQYYGVVGGDTDLSTYVHPVVKVRVKITGESEADGYIIRQKGASKYLVSDGTNTGVCVLANKADAALADGEMTVTVTLPNSSEVRLKRFSNKFGLDFSDNRYLLNFFEVSNDTVEKSGAEGTTTTIDLVQVDNPNLYG